MKAITITVDGNCELVDSSWEYEDINQFVNGWIEGVHLGDFGYMFINEEGKLINLEHNAIATHCASESNHLAKNDYIVGNVIIVGHSDDEGGSTDVPDYTINYFKDMGWIK